MGDNEDVTRTPVGLIHQSALQATIDEVKSALGPEVWHIAFRVGEDNTGTASIFFRITMQDSAMAETVISETTSRVATALFHKVRPMENWGLRPYVNFRSVSEQQRRPDPGWV